MFRRLAVVAVLALLAAGVPATADLPCPDLASFPEVGLACPRDDGLLDMYSSNGVFLGTTHGPDPAPRSSSDTAEAPPPVAPTCLPLGTAYTMRVIYARTPSAPNDAAAPAAIREMVATANAYLLASAAPFGVGTSLRVQCSGGVVDVSVVQLTTATRNFGAIVDELRARGFNDPTVKYWVWHDDGGTSCGGGIGHVYSDDRPGAENWNNGNGVPLFAVTWTCDRLSGAQVMSHENGHNMGAVQNSAPRSTLGLHCIDGLDIMCYDDDGANSAQYSTAFCPDETVYDCGNNDYFHPSPPAGNYLATHWNVGGANNRFLARTGCALSASGLLWAGNPAGMNVVGVIGWDIARQPIPSSCWGRPFGLAGVGTGPQDFDVCMETATTRLACYANAGSEQGVIPSGTTQAGIFYHTGVLGEWRLVAG